MAHGISVNVTLIFSLDRYRAVMDAHAAGLERARQAGHALTGIHSVASFFVSRVDTEVDRRLDAIGTPEALALKGRTAVANARLAYEAYESAATEPLRQRLAEAGARPQRPLGVYRRQGPGLPRHDVRQRAGHPGTVNTMPGSALAAYADHGALVRDAAGGRQTRGGTGSVRGAGGHVGVDFADVTDALEREGLAKFDKSWAELSASVSHELGTVDAAHEGTGAGSPPVSPSSRTGPEQRQLAVGSP